MAWYDAITNPVRGIGRILRGNVKEGMHDIGSSAKTLAPAIGFIPGVGTMAAAGIGAAGGAVEEMTDDDPGFDIGSPIAGGIGGYAGGKLAGHVGGVSGLVNAGKSGGVSGIGKVLINGAPTGTPATAMSPGGMSQVASHVASGGAEAGMSPLMKAALVGQGLGAASNAYGAYQMGRMEDRELARRREMSSRLSPYVSQLLARLSA